MANPVVTPAILLFGEGEALVQEIAGFLEANGYRVQPAASAEAARQLLREGGLQAAILDLDTAVPATRESLFRAFTAEGAPDLPMVALSASTDLRLQLQAIRAGCSASFTKPPDLQDLLAVLGRLLSPPETEPYRVLVVEDSRTMAAFITATLEQAGMVCTTVLDPLQALEVLPDFRPDLVLTDMYMPVCTGMELAALIRRNPAYLGIPIVYLSAETDTGKQLQALRTGGDDFLTKPIQPSHLISSVQIRAERTRLLRSQMLKDSLTGLLNHATLKERLAAESSRARRSGAPLSFAMVDIDHFKAVNDTHGHPIGDRVILALARLLQNRLRRSDIVGRYGGEEFGVILPDTTQAEAAELMDRLRQDFARISHQGAGGPFSVTFSCGVAFFEDRSDAGTLGEAADAALYEAKRGGRNRVVTAP